MSWAVTGTGLVSSLGATVGESFEAFCRAGSALHPLRVFEPSRYRVRAAYEMPDRADGTDRPGRATRWLCAAIRQALVQAGLADHERQNPAPRIAVLVGTGLAEQRSLELWWTAGEPLTPDRLHFAGAVAREVGLPGAITLVNACSASLFALAVATDLLALGEADAVVVAGTDAITESMFGLLDRVNGHPPTELRPFDVDRHGVLLGEGAAAVVVEPPDRAAARGVPPLALVRGVGTACDAYHVTAPLRAGMARAFRDAHDRAAVDPGQIDLIMAHATGTALNDETEALSLRDVFGEATGRPLVTALKSLIGHTSGASGLMSLVTAVAALDAGLVPPTLHTTTPIPAAEPLSLVTGTRRAAALHTAQVNAFGFGGVNAVAILDRTDTAGTERTAPGGGGVVVTGTGLAIPGVGSIGDLLRGRAAGPAVFDPVATLGPRGLRYKDRATVLGLCAVAHALADAGLPVPRAGSAPVDTAPAVDVGVVVSTTVAIAGSVCRVAETIHSGGVPATSPMDLPNVSGNVAASSIAIWFKLAGFNLTVSSGATSGVAALHLAATAIRSGRARRMIVVGVEPADPVAQRLLGTDPELTVFDGAVAVVLEATESSAARGATPLATVGRYTADNTDPGSDLWLTPCQAHAGGVRPAGTEQPGRRVDLSLAIGEAAGALGVLQCAVAADWLARNPDRRATISSGGCWGDGYASLGLAGTA
jgi:3-oxoacyl-[acyl-carrier-protein] synthase II